MIMIMIVVITRKRTVNKCTVHLDANNFVHIFDDRTIRSRKLNKNPHKQYLTCAREGHGKRQ